ncbi:MAG: hypothetical protein IT260_11405 [Saprospiraceae bacterium]|nr:hypothetical protein [Saprospiraceae bacterium]
MAFQRISLSPEALLEALQQTIKPLLYPSETDAPVEVQHLANDAVGDAFSVQDLKRLFYGGEDQFEAANIEWAEANRLESNGTQWFFRDLPDVLTTYPNNEYLVQEAYHRDQAPHWRSLRDLVFDRLVQQRWFRVDLAPPNQARADIYLVGRHLQIEFDPATNEIRTQALDWIVLKSFVIET